LVGQQSAYELFEKAQYGLLPDWSGQQMAKELLKPQQDV
jgi:hypothetical protein